MPQPLDPAGFIIRHTELSAPPHVGEIRLYLASEVSELWRKTEEELAEIGLPPPFWAFAWAGGQGLARYILDNPETVSGKDVIDFACGSGLVGIAAKMAGARRVVSLDTDPFCAAAVDLNFRANGLAAQFEPADMIGMAITGDVLLAGDVFYDRELAVRLLPWFGELVKSGVQVLVGDPGRAYLPQDHLSELAVYAVPSSRELEDSEVKRTTVWQFS